MSIDIEPNGGRWDDREVAIMLARVDERTSALLNEMRLLKESTVSKMEFAPVKSIVYGLVGIIMTSVIVAMVALVVKG